MGDFIMDFLDWFSDVINSAVDTAWLVAKIGLAIVIAILTLPLWILPFCFWLVFERR